MVLQAESHVNERAGPPQGHPVFELSVESRLVLSWSSSILLAVEAIGPKTVMRPVRTEPTDDLACGRSTNPSPLRSLKDQRESRLRLPPEPMANLGFYQQDIYRVR